MGKQRRKEEVEESPGGHINRHGCGVRQHEFSPEGYSAMNRALSRDRACAVSPSHFRYVCVCVLVTQLCPTLLQPHGL